jgi:hypothetical protein
MIDKVTDMLLSEKYSEKEALSMFIWKLSEIDPPMTTLEQSMFCVYYRINKSYSEISIENTETAFDILEIPKSKLGLTSRELRKVALIAYWEQFNNLTVAVSDMLTNARLIGMKKKALSYLI